MDPLIFLYDISFNLFWTCAIPFINFKKSPYLRHRWGLSSLPALKSTGSCVWIHTLSVGELLSALPFLKRMKVEFPEKQIILTVSTSAGFGLSNSNTDIRRFTDKRLIMPVDLPHLRKRLVKMISPSLFILVETDIWPGLLYQLKKSRVKCVLLNGRISPRTYKRYSRFSSIVKRFIDMFDLLFMQSDIDTKRLIDVGIDKSKVMTVGNIKFDQEATILTEEERGGWRKLLNLRDASPVWIAGSIHRGEEEIILNVYKRLKDIFSKLILIIAPRKLDMCTQLFRISQNMGFRTSLRSNISHSYDVLILDTMGELSKIYSVGDVSFVGGSFVPIGGHNLCEPAIFGIPVLFGPHIHNFLRMSEMLISFGGGKMVKDQEELFEVIRFLLSDPKNREDMGDRARRFVLSNKGAIDRVIREIRGLMECYGS
ncbi:MAG TPA: 3-deoxy-D-manno-octulosonic acid transferase [Desulfobacteraceae bacterium]|nr:3-deoxy-D-manno-octulosonic acid transferase [Desulfobacteraceae bacterium]